jgi:protein-arginine kinase activator protein McsA
MKEQTDAQGQTDGMYEVELILNSQIKELKGKLQEQMNIHREEKRDWKNVERALRDQIKQLKITIAVMESDSQTVIRHPYQSY